LAGSTGGGVTDRQALIKDLSDVGGTPQSRRETIRAYVDDMLAKKQELQAQWHHAMDSGGIRAPDFPVISDSAREAVIRMGYGDLLEKYGLQGGQPGAAPRSTLPPLGGSAVINGITVKRTR
jgi:hypothetical protein